MSSLALAGHQADVLSALRGLRGRATVGDVVAATGIAADEARSALKSLLESHRGHLEVADSGELLYAFDRRLIRRGSEPLLARFARGARSFLERAFKAWIVVTLVVYFVLFVVLVIAALVAGQRGRGGGGWGGGGRRRHVGLPNVWLWYWIWGPRWRLGRPYYGHRWERTLDRDDKVPFYKKVFAFVFGPDRPDPTQRQKDRSTLRLVRARGGVLSTPELVELTALPLPRAEEEMARLVGAYDGEPMASPEGELVYVFPELMSSAHGRVEAREPNPAWLRLEYPLDLTGNTPGANALVAGINGFNLLVGATAPWFLFPRLGLGGPVAFVGLVAVPVAFSTLFFLVPALRWISVRRENRRRSRRNVRRLILGLVYRDALGRGAGVTLEDARAHVARGLDGERVDASVVETVLHEVAAELEADVSPTDSGARFHFPALRRSFEASETVRRNLRLSERTPGEIVYSTADDEVEASAREMGLFDRALAGPDLDLERYLPAPGRADYEPDWEAVGFEEELAARTA